MTSSTLRLPATPTAPRRARQHLRQLRPAVRPDLLDDATLLLSEVVANAVTHGPPLGAITIAVEWTPAAVGVAVVDESDTVPAPREPEKTDDTDWSGESGRGQLVLDRIATAWGVRPVTAGKAVWFRLGPRTLISRTRSLNA